MISIPPLKIQRVRKVERNSFRSESQRNEFRSRTVEGHIPGLSGTRQKAKLQPSLVAVGPVLCPIPSLWAIHPGRPTGPGKRDPSFEQNPPGAIAAAREHTPRQAGGIHSSCRSPSLVAGGDHPKLGSGPKTVSSFAPSMHGEDREGQLICQNENRKGEG
jgi:hypothetical protein